jgi:myo-inositol 2-dehydrogenase/D-chiro-inositol 1-dehydrogenase
MGADHAVQLTRFVSDAVVTAIADLDRARAEAAAAALRPSRIEDDGSRLEPAGGGVRVETDPLALIADPAVDAVVIASADATHAELTLAAVEAGKPVLCEKPLTPSLAESLALRAAVGERAGLVSLGFMRRFDPGHARLRAAIEGFGHGRTLLLHCASRGVASAPGATSESAVTNSLIHELDSVPWLLGAPVVQASWQSPPAASIVAGTALQDPQLVLLRSADGALSTCELFLNARYGYDIRCEAVGETGVTSLVEPTSVVTDRGLLGRSVDYAADWRPRFADAYRLELQAWIDSLQPGRRRPAPLATLADGVAASAVAQAVIDSMHGGGAFVDVVIPA